MTRIEKSKEDARNLNELTDHLIKLLESDDRRFSFEFCAGGTMEIYDKEKENQIFSFIIYNGIFSYWILLF